MALPGVSSTWLDNQLSQPTPDVIRSQSILVIGTAEDGPTDEPITVRSIADAKSVFGSFAGGTLVRGMEEVFLSAGGPVDVRGLRLGGGNKAKREISESDGGTGSLAEEQTTGYALVLEARQPGNLYNQVSVGYRDGRNIEIFNPRSGLVSVFAYDPNRDNTEADVHTVAELVDAINADPNLISILTASYQQLIAKYEINARYGSGLETDAKGEWAAAASGIYLDSTGRTHVTLSDRTPHWTTAADDIDNSPAAVSSGVLSANLLDNQAPSGSYTSGNNIQRLIRVYSIADLGNTERLRVGGQSVGTFGGIPLNVAGRTAKQTLGTLLDYDNDGLIFLAPSGTTTAASEFRQVYDRLFIGTADGATTVFRWDAPVCPDDGDTTTLINSLVKGAIITGENIVATTTTGYATDDADNLVTQLVEKDGREHDWNGQTPTVSGSFSVYWDGGTAGRPVTEYSIAWDGSSATVASNGAPRGTVTFTSAPPAGTNLYLSYKSVTQVIPEHTTLASVTADSGAWDNWRRYFVAGQQVHFGATMPSDVEVRYMKVTDYEVGTQVELVKDPFGRQGNANRTDTYSTLRFNDPSRQPGPTPSGLSNTQDTILGVQYEYLPEWPDLTSFKSLAGGTNGSVLTNNDLYRQLDSAYNAIQNYPVDIIVPMGATMDGTKTIPNPVTGLTQTINAGFHTQLATLLNTLTENVDETLGIIGVVPPGTTSQVTIDSWVDNLTTEVPGSLTRGANVMAKFDERLMSIVAFEPVFVNDIEGQVYSANGQAAYAGLIASLPAQVAPTNQLLRSLVNVRFRLSKKQLERMNNTRLVTANPSVNTPGQFVITDGITAAKVRSDYVRLSTVRIVQQAMTVVRAVCDPFIGKANHPAAQVAMRAAITAGLKTMVEIGSLKGYNFAIVSTAQMQVQGLLDVELVLVPAFEIRRIRAVVRLQAVA